MPLINMTSDLTSLKYGRDRRDGASSGQPYFTKDIPSRLSSINFANSFLGSDFLIRGGVKAGSAVLQDEARLSKFFTDLRSPNGLLFIAKQNLLSKQAPLTGAAPSRVYNYPNTLAQVAVNPIGLHFMKQGNDLRIDDQSKYAYLTKNEYNGNSLGAGNTNKLLLLYETTLMTPTVDFTLPPTTQIGLGTRLRNFIAAATNFAAAPSKNWNAFQDNKGKFGIADNPDILLQYQGGPNAPIGQKSVVRRVFNTNEGFENNKLGTASNKYLVYSPNMMVERSNIGGGSTIFGSTGISNFATAFTQPNSEAETGVSEQRRKELIGDPVDYTRHNRQSIYKAGDPGVKGRDKSVYYTTKLNQGNLQQSEIQSVYSYDEVNAKSLYSSREVQKEGMSDMIKFNIGVLDLDSAGNSEQTFTWLHFRAALTDFSDTYNSTWNSFNYSGRGNSFYRYGGYNRSISMGFNVVVYSKYEQAFLYDKLNYLASVMAPNYSKVGWMRGNIIKLTVGDYLNGVYGALQNISFSIPEDSPWDIGRSFEGEESRLDSENSLQLPHVINVTGFQFIPLHDFRDETVSRKYVTGEKQVANQRFISMGSEGEGQQITQAQRKTQNIPNI